MKTHSRPETIVEQIGELADGWTMWTILTGTVLAGSITVAGLMLAVVLDIAFQFEGSGRGMVLAVWAGVSIAALLVFLVRALRQGRSQEGIARRLEQIGFRRWRLKKVLPNRRF
jgi:ABC-type sugar transport system permease subunit